MNESALETWLEANRDCLMVELAGVRRSLQRHIGKQSGKGAEGVKDDRAPSRSLAGDCALSPPPAIETLSTIFNLSPFERNLLLLCAGVELDGSFASLCAAAHGDPGSPYPTFGLALAVFADAHWSAMSPAGPLRRWRMIDIAKSNALVHAPLRIDERILNYITGIEHLDERLTGYVEPAAAAGELVPSHEELVERASTAWLRLVPGRRLTLVQLFGPDRASQRAVASAVSARAGLVQYVMNAHVIPSEPREREGLVRLWEREAVLSASSLLIDGWDSALQEPGKESALMDFAEGVHGAVIVSSRTMRHFANRAQVAIEVQKPSAVEQLGMWERELGPPAAAMDGKLKELAAQFDLDAAAIRMICADVRGRAAEDRAGDTAGADSIDRLLWDACRERVRPRLEDMVDRVKPVASWNDLVLPAPQLQVLGEIAAHVRQRMRVYEEWGFARTSSRGLGISTLFTGLSGTGKTMAAEVIAHDLRMDLYRIDLSQVVSKYIGETEKNLRRVFDAAEAGGAILLFDEADSLFGKRSEVKDSHDRYANIEISYLLQRMETYRGLAILTTNMKSAIDTAFLRRIRFVVQFPFPDTSQRLRIWRGIFPDGTPTEGLDYEKLASLNIAGGNIRNIAVYAAFLAAEAREPVCMRHLLRAARVEYEKIEKSLTEAEIRGWV